MNLYDDILTDILSSNNNTNHKVDNNIHLPLTTTIKPVVKIDKDQKEFNYPDFLSSLKENSIKNNFFQIFFSESLSVRDISHGCIRQTLYKLFNTPIENFRYVWLQLMLRNTIGHAIHNFIQSNYNFTEVEAAVKLENILDTSFTFSGVIDCIINDNILIEIKGLPYEKFLQILKSGKPREEDKTQVLVYKYIIENHIDKVLEYKNSHPDEKNFIKLNKYNINKIQIIYVPHDIWLESEDPFDTNRLKEIKQHIKEKISSKYSDILMEVIDVDIDLEYDNIVKNIEEKIKMIYEYFQKKKIPDKNNKFINKKSCAFCLYRNICKFEE